MKKIHTKTSSGNISGNKDGRFSIPEFYTTQGKSILKKRYTQISKEVYLFAELAYLLVHSLVPAATCLRGYKLPANCKAKQD